MQYRRDSKKVWSLLQSYVLLMLVLLGMRRNTMKSSSEEQGSCKKFKIK